MNGTHTAADPGTVLISWQHWLWCPQDRACSSCLWVCVLLVSVAVGGMRAVTWAGSVSQGSACTGGPGLGHSWRS